MIWERMSPSLRVVLGMIVFAIIGYNSIYGDDLLQLYAFSSVPAGWYVLNRILDWIIPKWDTGMIIVWRWDDFIFWRFLKVAITFPIKLGLSFIIGVIVAPYFLYRLGRDITLMVKNKDVTPHSLN